MSDSGGQWLTIAEFAAAEGISEADAESAFDSGRVLTKLVSGEKRLWREGSSGGSALDPGEMTGMEKSGPAADGPDEFPAEQTEFSRVPITQELAMQTERALSLVERSLGALLMMHQQVVQEKDRSVERSRDGQKEKEQALEERQRRIEELTRLVQEKDQEIADLKMLVEILEGQSGRPQAPGSSAGPVSQKASVGDLMEEQLRYLMEEQMVKDLLKE